MWNRGREMCEIAIGKGEEGSCFCMYIVQRKIAKDGREREEDSSERANNYTDNHGSTCTFWDGRESLI